MRPQPDFIHEFVPGSSSRTLLLLHGTGGNERDLIPLGRELDPNAALLSPRGKVLENGMPRFFRRLAEGVFDLEDLKYRTNELADFVTAAGATLRIRPLIMLLPSVILTAPTSPPACYCFGRRHYARCDLIPRDGAANSGDATKPLFRTCLDWLRNTRSNYSHI